MEAAPSDMGGSLGRHQSRFSNRTLLNRIRPSDSILSSGITYVYKDGPVT